MTSKIVVNNIEADAGVSTVFFNSDIGATDGTLNVDGNLSVDGVITYEDVTSVDSVGVVTARTNIFLGNSLKHLEDDDTLISFPANDTITAHTNGSERLRIESTGRIGINTISSKVNGLHVYDKHFALSEGYPITWLQPNSSSSRGRMTVDSGGNYLFQFGSANEEKIRFKSNGNIGIGTDNPTVPLQVTSSTTDVAIFESISGDEHGSQISIKSNSASPADDDKIAVLDFSGKDDAGNNTTYAQIRSHSRDVTNGTEDGDITFHTRSNGSFGERVRITSGGNVGIGTDTTDRHLAIYHDTQATIELKTSDTGQSSLWFTDLSDGNIGGVYYTHNNNKMVLRVSDAARMTITGIGSVGIGQENPINRLHVDDNGATISSTGDAILNSTQKGIRIRNANNNDTSLGLWFTTGDSHCAGITGQRNDTANTWGTDLRFYTHEDATNDLTYARERHRINPHGLLINRKGNNAINTGGNILGRYKYTQMNQGSGYAHLILGPDGRKLQDYIGTNCYCIITVCVTGTGTNNMFCQYYYHATSSANSSTLTHMYGNSGASSNRPYMNLQNTHDPAWVMTHNGGYRLDIEVAIYGGTEGFTYTDEFGDFTTNP